MYSILNVMANCDGNFHVTVICDACTESAQRDDANADAVRLHFSLALIRGMDYGLPAFPDFKLIADGIDNTKTILHAKAYLVCPVCGRRILLSDNCSVKIDECY